MSAEYATALFAFSRVEIKNTYSSAYKMPRAACFGYKIEITIKMARARTRAPYCQKRKVFVKRCILSHCPNVSCAQKMQVMHKS